MGKGIDPSRGLLVGAILFLVFSISTAGCGLSVQGRSEPTLDETAFDAPEEDAIVSQREFELASVPSRDLLDLTRRFNGNTDIPQVARKYPLPFTAGDSSSFWYKDNNTGENLQIEATLRYSSDQLRLWIEDGISVDDAIIGGAAQVIEEQILPRSRAFFGREWQPGIDGDSRVNVLHVGDLGDGTAGYFSQADEFVTAVNRFSNEQELIYVSLKQAPIGSDRYYHVIAHEMQHMIHWNVDSNEEVWVNEGLSELSAYLVGIMNQDYLTSFFEEPDVQLTDFEYDGAEVNAHYGAAFLFFAYYLDRFGEAATRDLVSQQENGTRSIDQVVSTIEPATGFVDFFQQWLVANYLDHIDNGQDIYGYRDIDLPEIEPAEIIDRFPTVGQSTVRQFGADYLVVRNQEPVTMLFTGTQKVPLIGTDPESGRFIWSSHPSDNSDLRLYREIDLSQVDKATLTFSTWFELEEGWDYAYVTVSADNGNSWQALEASSSTHSDPQGNSYGPAYTGVSGGGDTPIWLEETVDLSEYAGQKILLQFETINDDTINYQGFVVDDIAIPELGFFDDVEEGSGEWQADGFVRHANILPQEFLVQAILFDGSSPEIIRLELDPGQLGRWELPLDEDVTEAVIIISATAPVTTHPAGYRYSFSGD
jgi:hypothetical protein